MATVRHLEFQLQREKALASELTQRCRELQAHVATLEQEKAELRRDKQGLADDAARCGKLLDRVHALHKDVEDKNAALAAEQARCAQLHDECEAVRSNAKSAIAVWVDAEARWLEREEQLRSSAATLRAELDALRDAHAHVVQERDAVRTALDAEREQTRKLSAQHDADVVVLQQLRDDVSALRQAELQWRSTELQLRRVADEAHACVTARERDIAALRDTCAQLTKAEEQLQCRVAQLSDRLAGTKAHCLQLTAAKEQLVCSVADAEAKAQRVAAELASVQRERDLATQAYDTARAVLDEQRDQTMQLQEQLRGVEADARRHEAECVRLREALQRCEEQRAEDDVLRRASEDELQRAREELNDVRARLASLQASCESATAEAQLLRMACKSREDEAAATLARAAADADALRACVAARTTQLALAQHNTARQALFVECSYARALLVCEHYGDVLVAMRGCVSDAATAWCAARQQEQAAQLARATRQCGALCDAVEATADGFCDATRAATHTFSAHACALMAQQLCARRADEVDATAAAVAAATTTRVTALERRCRELATFAREAKAAMASRDASDAVRCVAQHAVCATLQGHVDMLLAERSAVQGAYARLLRTAASPSTTRAPQANAPLAVLSRECGRLRRALSYELERKLAYKAALAEAKRLRAVCDAKRADERQRATRAIERANGEVRYWRTCFDELKASVTHTHASPTHVRERVTDRPMPDCRAHSSANSPPTTRALTRTTSADRAAEQTALRAHPMNDLTTTSCKRVRDE